MIDEAELARLEAHSYNVDIQNLIAEVRRLQELSRGRFDENKELWQWFNASQQRVQELEAALEAHQREASRRLDAASQKYNKWNQPLC